MPAFLRVEGLRVIDRERWRQSPAGGLTSRVSKDRHRAVGHVGDGRIAKALLHRCGGLIQTPVQRAQLPGVRGIVQRAVCDPSDRVHRLHHLITADLARRTRQYEAATQTTLAMDQARPSQRLHYLGEVPRRGLSRRGYLLDGVRPIPPLRQEHYRTKRVLRRLRYHPLRPFPFTRLPTRKASLKDKDVLIIPSQRLSLF